MSNSSQTPSEYSPLLQPSAASSSTSSTLTDVHPRNDTDSDYTVVSKTRGVLISVSIFVLIFILTFNISLLTTIQSPIATSLEAYQYVSWFASAYLISITSITPITGRLSQIFTPRVYLLASICVQCCGLLITAFAPKLWLFLVGRVITGIGTAAVTPVAFILVTELTSKKRRGLLFGLINSAYTSGVALGAIIAGALEPAVGWRAVFWLQIPITFAAAATAFFTIPPSRPTTAGKADAETSISHKLARVDYLGVITLISAVVLLLYSLASSQVHPTPIVISAFMLGLFLLVESRWAREPIVPMPVLKSRGNLLTGLATIGLMTARWGVLFYTPVYAIAVRGWSPASAGLMLLPTNGGFACGGILAGWLHIRRTGSFYTACLVCFGLFATTLFGVSQLTYPSSHIAPYIILLFANGFTTGALLNYNLAHVLHLTPLATHVIVIPLNAMFRSLSGSFGSSISGGLFLRNLHGQLESNYRAHGVNPNTPAVQTLITKLIGTPALVRSLTDPIDHQVAVDGYTSALQTLFGAGVVLAVFAAVVQACTGWTAPLPVPEDNEGEDSRHGTDALSPIASREPVGN